MENQDLDALLEQLLSKVDAGDIVGIVIVALLIVGVIVTKTIKRKKEPEVKNEVK